MMTEAIPIANAKVRLHCFGTSCGCYVAWRYYEVQRMDAMSESRRPRTEKISHDRTNHMEVHLGRSTVCA